MKNIIKYSSVTALAMIHVSCASFEPLPKGNRPYVSPEDVDGVKRNNEYGIQKMDGEYRQFEHIERMIKLGKGIFDNI